MRSLVLVFVVGCASAPQQALAPPGAPPAAPPAQHEPGLAPPEPVLRLPRNFLPTSYAARLAIDPARDGFSGAIAITGDVAVRSAVIWLHGRHLQVSRAVARREGRERIIAVTARGDDLLELRPAQPLEPGGWTLALEYTGDYDLIDETGAYKRIVRGEPYVYSQFESIYARRAFPCFDEPDSKVPWQLTLDVPAGLTAVSNSPSVREQPLGGDQKRVEFAPTRPLPSYLIAFGVGSFDLVDAGKTASGTPIRVITMKGRAPEAAYAARTAPHILELLEGLFASRYPYAKLDLLATPVAGGAMENAGLVTVAEPVILQDPAHPSKRAERTWVWYAAHELAHQWFGDLVTMAWWDDIWLNEGFANWAGNKITAAFEPAWHQDLFSVNERSLALGEDALVSARQIRQPIVTRDDILDAFDPITYEKGAAVLDMVEGYLGRDVFLGGVRAYLGEHAFGNAVSSDFLAAISRAAGKDMSTAFATFLDRPGAPELAATVVCEPGKPARLALSQQRYVPPGATAPADGKAWLVPVCAAYDRGGQRGEACTVLDAATGSLALDTQACPRWAMPNIDGRGYYRNAYSEAQVVALRDLAWAQLRPTERTAAMFDIAAAATSGRIPLSLGLSFVPRLLAAGDQFSIGAALSIPLSVGPLVPDELRPRYEDWMRRTFGPAARRAGLVPSRGDDLDVEAARGRLINAAGSVGRDPVLVAQAVKLAESWRDLPDATRGAVLTIAVHASPAVFDRVLAGLPSEPDHGRRREIAAALGSTPDVERQRAALAVTLDPRLEIWDTRSMLYRGAFEANRRVAQQFIAAHLSELLKRAPESGASLAYAFTQSCSAKRRDEIARYVTETFAALPSGPRTVQQAIEGMDQCIAGRALLEPELRRWLGGTPGGAAR